MSDDKNPFTEYSAGNPFAKYAPAPEKPSVGEDVVKSGGIGIVKGTIGLAGSLGDFGHILGDLRDKYITNPIANAIGAEPVDLSKPDPALKIGSQALREAVESKTGKFYEPKTTAGEYAQTAGEFLPAAIGGPETLGARLLNRVAIPAAVSETAGQMTKGTAAEPWARVAGAVVSPAAVSAVRRAVTPIPANATRTALADTLANEGVELTAGQRTGSKPLQWVESVLGDMPGSGGVAGRTMERQAEQFTSAALRRTGETAERATPDVIDNAFRRIGQDFDNVASRNHVTADYHLGHDLVTAEGEYNSLVGPTQRAPVVANHINDIRDMVAQNGGHLTGDQYNALTSRLARQARGAGNDPQLQTALSDIREAVDDAFERSLQRSGNTQDLDALRTARRQYRNLLVVEKAATGAGSNAAEGLISPSQLRNATVVQNRRAYARGQGDFADLSRAGAATMTPLPQSGTAPRQYIQHLITTAGGIAGGASGGLPGAIAGFAAPAAAGRVVMSRPVQAWLGNQLLGQRPGSRSVDAAIAAILARQGGT